MKVIGITGGIGCGKSHVAEIAAERFDLLHIDTDAIARRQMKKGGASYEAVVSAFTDSILGPDGEIDRAALGAIVFADPEKLKLLNSLTHPRVTETVQALIVSAEDMYEGVLVETAILREAGYERLCDEIICVRAPLEQRIARLQASRGLSRERAMSTIGSQADDEGYAAYATLIVDNPDGTDDEAIIQQLSKLFTEKLTEDEDEY